MMIIKINNPYFDKIYKVAENIGDIEYVLKNIDRGNQRSLYLHDYETGEPIIILSACCASVEFKAEELKHDKNN